MNKISRRLYIPLFFLACMLSLQARAAIVDINPRLNDLGNPLEIFLEAGTYTVTSTGIADGGAYDGWSNWSSTTCAVATGCAITSPTSFTGFRSAYNILSADISVVEVDGASLTPVFAEPTAPDLFSDFFFIGNRYHVDDSLVYPSALLALANARSSQFTLAVRGLVGFAINDVPLSDNRGGVSLLLSEVSAIPIPAAIWLFGTALIGLVGFSKRRKAA